MLSKLFPSATVEQDSVALNQILEEPARAGTGEDAHSPQAEEDVDKNELVVPQEEDPAQGNANKTGAPVPSHSEADVSAVRDLILTLHKAIVPELISGESIDELIASIEPAQLAYKRIVSAVSVPAGGNAPITLDPDSISSFDKIRRGLSTNRTK